MSNDTNDLGLIAYQQGDYATAFTEWKKLADEGNIQAYQNIAMLYAKGEGVEQNDQLAQQWCEKAANAGHAIAQYYLGYMLLQSNPQTALKWWQKAAENGVADAQHDLAQQYLLGELVEQDLDTAADWYEAAANQDHAPSQYNLGVLYANVKQYANARFWWEKAAAQHFDEAQKALDKLTEMNF